MRLRIFRTLIGAGTLVLLFAAYQLWGTGLSHDRAQDRLSDEFATRLEEVADPASPETTTTAPSTTTSTTDGATTTEPGPAAIPCGTR